MEGKFSDYRFSKLQSGGGFRDAEKIGTTAIARRLLAIITDAEQAIDREQRAEQIRIIARKARQQFLLFLALAGAEIDDVVLEYIFVFTQHVDSWCKRHVQ